MNFRGLYKWAGVCAVIYAIGTLVSYGISVSTNGFMLVSATPPSPDRILAMLQLRGNQIAFRLDLVSYFFWIPAMVGLFAYLRERRPGRAHLGGAFAALGLIGLFISSALGSAMMSMAQGAASDLLKERLAALDLVSLSIMMPALYAITASSLLWGSALRTQLGLARTVGSLFLLQVVGFVIASAGFMSTQDLIGNIGILINSLAVAATYVAAALFLQRASKEAEIKPVVQEKPRAAGAQA